MPHLDTVQWGLVNISTHRFEYRRMLYSFLLVLHRVALIQVVPPRPGRMVAQCPHAGQLAKEGLAQSSSLAAVNGRACSSYVRAQFNHLAKTSCCKYHFGGHTSPLSVAWRSIYEGRVTPITMTSYNHNPVPLAAFVCLVGP